MNVVSKQLIRIAKTLMAEVKVDSTDHTLDELSLWITKEFKNNAPIVLHEIFQNKTKYIIDNAKYQAVSTDWNGVYFIKNNSDIQIRKTFAIPLNKELEDYIGKKTQKNNIFVNVDINNKDVTLDFEITLKKEQWFPLFRSCREQIYFDQETGNLDSDSLKLLEEKLKDCFEKLQLK